MVRLDSFFAGIRDGRVLDNVSFELLALDKKGSIKKLRFSGAYVIVDNGYLDWSCTIPPFGVSNNIDEIRWSKMARIDAERCRVHIRDSKGKMEDILKSGVRLHGVDAVDSVWFSCCALHNWLLEIDGLTEKWVVFVRL
jgi:hypothetical protein